MADPVKLYPLNDLALTVKLQDINPATGVKSPLTVGTVTAFLATSDSPTAVAADGTLSMSATHIGSGKWLVFFDATVLTPALLATHFASTPPVLIVVYPSGIRAYLTLEYQPSRPGTLV